MKEDYFAYPMPPTWKLREEFITPYRFSEPLQELVKQMFEHPQHNKYRGLFTNLHKPSDLNDMLKSAYLCVKYFKSHPQQFGNAMDNIVPWIIVRMWKTFIGINKNLRGKEFNQYYPSSMKLLVIGRGKFLDQLLEDIKNENYINEGDDMIKQRTNIGLRERKPMRYSEKEIKYLENL